MAITRASDLTGPLRRHTTTSSEEIVAFCGWEESEGPEDDGGRKINNVDRQLDDGGRKINNADRQLDDGGRKINNADRQLDDGALKRLMSDLLG